ncbi:aerobactin siderophore biosynthesis protein iucB [Plectosphaerella cucumerina]|uniref:Aerobactin siderophore biosynthesis protein iucB n=1 Tax=Plectosphaerella cucumerina TaxID=40658 RepID=A0A8K0TLN0_9PEZI|nr:aerobactin siderophore biosynthesis protein iucB [Plectosphaerella cucumerina]
MSGTISLATFPSEDTLIKLPHPYLTEYAIRRAFNHDDFQGKTNNGGLQFFQLIPRDAAPSPNAATLPEPLHSADIYFTEPAALKSSELPPDANNSAWARARRSPSAVLSWEGNVPPTLAQAWLVVYALFTARLDEELIRLEVRGSNASLVAAQLRDVFLAIAHPVQNGQQVPPITENKATVVLLRSAFFQGAGSPFGARAAWLPAESPASLPASRPLSSYPLTPLHHTMTLTSASDPANPGLVQQAWHPVRPAKPAPGAVVYSRWIPHLKETFSMVALDYTNAEHLRLFHEWQNDPRVSQGWNETGTLDQHREYLRRIHEDPHQVALLAAWDGTFFAYFEVYWAKEDKLGGYYDAQDWDRGRHSLVGDVRFRGPHRVSAWWSSLVHYLFLDDPRTSWVVGEPKKTNDTVLMYDFMHGFGLDKFVDLPHKRSAFVRLSRERFFQLCPLGDNEKVVGGMRIGLVPKL